jgi:c-di-GMP phosphodiesterase
MAAQVETRVAAVRVVGAENLVHVPITGAAKPEIPESFEQKWQEIVTLAARIINVPAGLIMRLRETDIEVFTSSSTDGNPYEEGERAELGLGLYCETVVGRRAELIVPHALEDPDWRSNPDVKLEMYSYLGVPVRWPDGEVFGTFCVLDRNRNEYTQDQRQLLRRLAELVEGDLRTIAETSDLLGKAELRDREIRHRIKNQFNLLISYIDLHRFAGERTPDTSELAHALAGRIRTLARIHEHMTQLHSGATASLAAYLRELVTSIASSAPFGIEVSVHGMDVELDERTLVPVASIVNELTTNSIKHAFSGVSEPRIDIAIVCEDGKVELEYRDNGVGGVDKERESGGLGRMIVEGLAAQLSATTERSGSHFRLRFAPAE